MTRTLPLVALCLALLAPSLYAVAGDAPAAYEYRETMMSSLGKHMKLTSMIVRGEIDRPGDRLGHAKALHAASKDMASLFPEGTGPDVVPTSESKPEVWTDRPGFEAAVAAYAEATTKLVEAAKSEDDEAFKAAFQAVGKQCGACHNGYRIDKKDKAAAAPPAPPAPPAAPPAPPAGKKGKKSK